MSADTILLSRAAPIEPGAISQRNVDKAGRLVAAGTITDVRYGPSRAIGRVRGDTATHTVRLDLTVRVWSGSCSHFDALDVPQQRRAPICSHILALAYHVAEHLGLDIPDPRTAPPPPVVTVPAPALAAARGTAAPERPADPTDLAEWRRRRAAETERFYD